jgi:hypothetical protein
MTLLPAFVHIIESPSANDLLDGRTEGRVLNEILNLANIPHCYNLVTTKETFNTALGTRLDEASMNFQKNPILHLSMHGNEDGIALTDNTFLEWADLQARLTPLNNHLEGKLLICMSSCFSSSGCWMAMNEDKDEPFWALVGNKCSVSWENAAVAYVTFYHLLFKNTLVEKSQIEEYVEYMKLASKDNNFEVWWGHTIKTAWAKHIKELS